MKRILFRADGNSEIGYGHIMRSLALAEMLKNDFECIFVTRFVTEFLQNEILKTCSRLIKLTKEGDYHLNEFINILNGQEIVVLDNYFFDTNYQIKIKNIGSKLVCIDDLANKHFVADLIINHIDISPYKKYSIEKYTTLCLGIEHVLLRNIFFEKVKNTRLKENKLLVAFGGTDFNNLTYQLVSNLLKLKPELNIIAILNDENKKYFHLLELEENSPNLKVFSNLSGLEVRNIMLECNIGILPASTICLEALILGLDVITGHYVDNQKYAYRYLVDNCFVSGLDDLNNIDSNKLLELLTKCLEKSEDKTELINRMNTSSRNHLKVFKSLAHD